MTRPADNPAPLGDPLGREPVGAGVAISAAIHGAVLLAAVFGVDFLSRDTAEMMVFEDVALISGPEFDAAISKAPDAPKSTMPALSAPMAAPDAAPDAAAADAAPIATNEFVVADAVDEELFPDLTAVLTPLARAKVRPAQVASLMPAPNFGAAPSAPASLGMSSMRAPGAPAPQTMSGARRGSALRIDTAPPPPEDRVAPEAQPRPDTPNRADEKVVANAPDPDAPPDAPVEEALKAAAPDAATEEIVTEADIPQEEPSAAPLASAPPVGRPAGRAQELAAGPDAAPEATPEAGPEATPTATTAASPAASPATQSADAGTATAAAGADLPLGDPLTGTEIGCFKDTISKFWRKDVIEGMQNYEEVVVTLRITVDPQGGIEGEPEVIRSKDGDGRFPIAEGTASTALKRAKFGSCASADKFARWQVMEVTFNPVSGVSM